MDLRFCIEKKRTLFQLWALILVPFIISWFATVAVFFTELNWYQLITVLFISSIGFYMGIVVTLWGIKNKWKGDFSQIMKWVLKANEEKKKNKEKKKGWKKNIMTFIKDNEKSKFRDTFTGKNPLNIKLGGILISIFGVLVCVFLLTLETMSTIFDPRYILILVISVCIGVLITLTKLFFDRMNYLDRIYRGDHLEKKKKKI